MVDREIAARHIREHYRPDDYLAVVLIRRGPDGRATEVKHEFGIAEVLAGEKRQAHFRAANASGCDIYMTINSLVPGTRNREKADVQSIRHLYLDIDKNAPEVLDRIVRSREVPLPSKVIATSPGKGQVLWKVAGFSKDEAEAVVRGMAVQYGADQAVWDCARILRVPGFRNTKYIEPFYARIIPGERGHGIFTPAEFPRYPEIERQIARGEGRKIDPGHHSMSEQEWGKVMRKLEQGEDPARIESWLAVVAADRHKPSPQQYASRTIKNALYRLRQRGPRSNAHSQHH